MKFKDRYGLIGKAPSGFQFSFVFQDAVLADIPDMRELQWVVREALRGNTSDPTWRENMAHYGSDTQSAFELAPNKERPGWACRLDGVLRGFSIADLPAGKIAALYVDPDFERSGVGRQLHNGAVEWLFANGLHAISITAAPYTRAQKFLHAAGWKLVDVERSGEYRLELTLDVWLDRRNRF